MHDIVKKIDVRKCKIKVLYIHVCTCTLLNYENCVFNVNILSAFSALIVLSLHQIIDWGAMDTCMKYSQHQASNYFASTDALPILWVCNVLVLMSVTELHVHVLLLAKCHIENNCS